MTWNGAARIALVRKAGGAAGPLVVLDGQMPPAQGPGDGHGAEALAALAIGSLELGQGLAVDGHVEDALAGHALLVPQLGQVLDVHVEDAKVVVVERATLPPALGRGRAKRVSPSALRMR